MLVYFQCQTTWNWNFLNRVFVVFLLKLPNESLVTPVIQIKQFQVQNILTSHIYSVSVSALISSGRTSFPSYGPIQVPAGIRFRAHTPYPTQGMLDVHKQTSSGNLRMEPFSKGLWDCPALTSFLSECNGPCIGHSPSCFSLQISHPMKKKKITVGSLLP